MKVAILLSGLPRFVDNQKILDSFHQHLFSKYDLVDVYAQCWYDVDGNYGNQSSWSKDKGAELHIPHNAIELIQNNFDPVRFLIDKPLNNRATTNSIHLRLQNRFPNNQFLSPDNVYNIASQFQAISSVASLIPMLGDKYDFYVLARYDAVLENIPDLEELDPAYYYVPQNGHFNDLVNIFGGKYFLGYLKKLYENFMWDGYYHDVVELPIPEMYRYEMFNNLSMSRSGVKDWLRKIDMYAHVIRNRSEDGKN